MSTNGDYRAFLERKALIGSFDSIPLRAPLHPKLFPHARDLTSWALRRGRAAIFADTGLCKTSMQLSWAQQVALGGERVLILAPLAVAEQTVREGAMFDIQVVYARRPHESDAPIIVTNYELLDHFDPADFAGIVLDESSILKAYDSRTRTKIIEAFRDTPYRLACTATPAPNDYMELGNHAEFLGVKTRAEMLAEFFVHDGGRTSNWRLKGHAEDSFWQWLAQWAVVLRMPSDIGHEDGPFILPPLREYEHVVRVDHAEAQSEGYLFAPQAVTLNEQRATRRMTMDKRVAKVAEIVAEEDSPALVWCELNAEADACEAAIPGAVQVRGNDSLEDKRDRLLGFAEGRYSTLVSKASICGHGMNWQHCHRVIFAGASHSYEQTYQAVRRCWRFGQTQPVEVHVIRAETENAVMENYRRKDREATQMHEAMLQHVRDLQEREVHAAVREWNEYSAAQPMEVPYWISETSA